MLTWLMALALPLSVAIQLMGADQSGMRRWQADMDDASTLVSTQWEPLTRGWCTRDGVQIIRSLSEQEAMWFASACPTANRRIAGEEINLQRLLDSWREESDQRLRDIRAAMARLPADHKSPAPPNGGHDSAAEGKRCCTA